MNKLILGSLSPRRAELIKKISGWTARIVAPNIIETIIKDETALQNVSRLAMIKAQNVFDALQNEIDEETVVLGCDTIVVIGGKILGKPKSEQDAIEMFKLLENNVHYVYTAVCFISKTKKIEKIGKTSVTFGALNDKIVYNYIKAGNSYDKAGGYGLQDSSIASMIVSVEGDKDNVIGLPTKLIAQTLSEHFSK